MRFGTAFALSMAFVFAILLMTTPFVLIDLWNGPMDGALAIFPFLPVPLLFAGCFWVAWKFIGPFFVGKTFDPFDDGSGEEISLTIGKFVFLLPILALSILTFGWLLFESGWRYGWILGLLCGGLIFGVGFEIVFLKENLRRFLQVPAVNPESPEFQRLEERRRGAVEFLQELNGEIEVEPIRSLTTPTATRPKNTDEHRF